LPGLLARPPESQINQSLADCPSCPCPALLRQSARWPARTGSGSFASPSSRLPLPSKQAISALTTRNELLLYTLQPTSCNLVLTTCPNPLVVALHSP
jgi:hypothetical protein